MTPTLKPAVLFFILLCAGINPVFSQSDSSALRPSAMKYHLRDTQIVSRNYRMDEQFFSFQWDLLLNPVYITQISGKYKLNGRTLDITPTPRFYALLPGQNALLGNTITDEAGCYYLSFRMPLLENSKIGLLHHTRLIIGITHDKLQTGSSDVYYKYSNGGTEATVLLDKNISYNLSAMDFKKVSLIFNWNVQAGLFASLAKVQANIVWQGDSLKSTNDARWQFPNPRSGWGGLIASNVEVGGFFCHDYFISQDFSRNSWVGQGLFWFFRRFGVTVGARILAEGLHSGTDVTVNGKSGYHLTANNYAAFFSGPILGIKWLNKL